MRGSRPKLFETPNPKDLLQRALVAVVQGQQGSKQTTNHSDKATAAYTAILAPHFLENINDHLTPFNKPMRKHFQTEKDTIIRHFHHLRNQDEDGFSQKSVVSIIESLGDDTVSHYSAPKSFADLSKHLNFGKRISPAKINNPYQAMRQSIRSMEQEGTPKEAAQQHLLTLMAGFLSDIPRERQDAVNHFRELAKQYPGSGSPALKAAGVITLILGVCSVAVDMALGSNIGWADSLTLALATFSLLILALSIYLLVSAKSTGLGRTALKLTNALQADLPRDPAGDVHHRVRGSS